MAPPVDGTRRYDLYLCAASSGAIAPVASSASARLSSIDAGDLANAVFDSLQKRAQDSGRTASVFYAPRCVQGSNDEASDAVLQTRGGGTALFMFSKPFLLEDRCVGELLQFLTLDANAQAEEKVKFRFVCVGVTAAEILQDPRIGPYASVLRWHRIHALMLTTLSAATFEIVKLGWDAWLFPSSPNVLGATVKDSLLDLLGRVFHDHEVSVAKLVFGVKDPNATTLAAVFSAALSMYKTGGGFDGSALLDHLVTVSLGFMPAEKRAAIAAYKRKWSLAGAWDWSSDARDRLKPMSASILTAPASSVNPDEDAVQPPGFVQPNPRGVLLDYDNPATEEGGLKRLLLESDSARDLVAAVGASSGLAAVHGMGGVGKTCALRGLGSLPDMWRRFPGGIFFIGLGQSASVGDVLRMLSNVMRACGDTESAERVTTCATVKDAVDIVVATLSSATCLFLVDDVWPTTLRIGGHLDDLQHLIESNERSRVVFSTRDKKVAGYAGAHSVSFGMCDEAASKRMLLKYSGFTEEEADSMPSGAVESLQHALRACGGLRMALAVTGLLVKRQAGRLPKHRPKSDAWARYHAFSLKQHALCKDAHHPGLSAAFLVSISEVEARLRDTGCAQRSAAEMYRSLCVLQKQSLAPKAMLSVLWSADESQVMSIAEEFEALSLLSIESEELYGDLAHGVRLHDHALDFCHQVVVSRGESTKEWHATLLRQYLPHDTVTADSTRPWWSVRNDGYIFAHVTRHLLACHEVVEASRLLLDFRYILAQVKHNGLHFVTQDLNRVMGYLREADGDQNDETWHSIFQALELLTNAIGRSWSGIVGDARTLSHRIAFQLLGRLNHLRAENADVARLLRSVVEYGPAPFLRPLSLTLSTPTPGLRMSLGLGNWVKAVAWIRGSNRVVVATATSRALLVLDIFTGQTVHKLMGHEEYVSCVAAFGSGSEAVVVSGGDDGTLRFWSAETGQESGHYIQATKGEVVALAASQDGKFVVSSTGYGEVKRWRADTKEEAGNLVASGPESLGDVVTVAISSSGRRIAAGTSSGDVWLWDLEGVRVGATVTGVKLGAHSHGLHVIAIAADGETVVSGGYDPAIRFWDAREQRPIGDSIEASNAVLSLCASDSGHIYCGLRSGDIHVYDVTSRRRCVRLLRDAHTSDVAALDVSADGRRLVSGGPDGFVRLWDLAPSGEWVGSGQRSWGSVGCIAASTDGLWVVTGHDEHESCAVRVWSAATGEAHGSALRGHEDPVKCVTMSPDSRLVVSGSADRTVRVWSVNSREEVVGPLRGHSNWVSCVAISADGARIVSGSFDGTVRIWDMTTGAILFAPLGGHGSYVRSVIVSSDGRWIASGSEDCVVRVWDMRTGAAAGEPLQVHPGSVRSATVTVQSLRVVGSGRLGGEVRAWSIAAWECTQIAKRGGPLCHSNVNAMIATNLRSKRTSSAPLSIPDTGASNYVYRGDPVQENIVAVFDSNVLPNMWHFDSERQRLWVVFEDRTLATADCK